MILFILRKISTGKQNGSTCGRKLKAPVIREFSFERASFVVDVIDDMLNKTSRTKRPNTKKRGACDEPTSSASGAVLYAEDNMNSLSLGEMEKEMNKNEKLHPILEKYPLADTCITVCKKCGKRLVNFGEEIHAHEYHSCAIIGDLDYHAAERMKEEARPLLLVACAVSDTRKLRIIIIIYYMYFIR